MIQRLGVFDFDLLFEEELNVPLPLILPRRLPTASVVTSSPAPIIHFLIKSAALRCAGDRYSRVLVSSESEMSPSSVRRALGSLAIRVLTLRAESTVSAAEGAAAAAASAFARLARLEVAALAKIEDDELISIAVAQRSRARAAVLSTGRGAILFEFFLSFSGSKRLEKEEGEEARFFFLPSLCFSEWFSISIEIRECLRVSCFRHCAWCEQKAQESYVRIRHEEGGEELARAIIDAACSLAIAFFCNRSPCESGCFDCEMQHVPV